MIILRKKTFSASKNKVVKEVIDKGKDVIDKAKKNPKVTTALSTTSLGLGALNLGINLKRGRNEERFQKDQIDATNKLSDIIANLDNEGKSVENLDNGDKKKLKKELKKQKKLLKHSQKPYVSEGYLDTLDELVSDLKKERR